MRKLRASGDRESTRGVLGVASANSLVRSLVAHALTKVIDGVVTASQLILVFHYHLALVRGVRTISSHAAGTVVHVSEGAILLHFGLRPLHLHALLQKLDRARVLDKEARACVLLLVRQLNASHAGLH